MGKALKQIVAVLASMRLTVPLLALGMALVFAGTLAQTNQGIWAVQKQYFHSIIIWAGPVPLPGGYIIGGLMLLNLLLAHLTHFKFSWKRSGVVLIHVGVAMLLFGEFITSHFAVEMQMSLAEGQTLNYAQDIRESELAVIDPSNPDHDSVVAIDQSWLTPGRVIRLSTLPFEIRVERYYMNSTILGPAQAAALPAGKVEHLADAGFGAQLVAVDEPDDTDPKRVNIPTTLITLSANGKKLGTYMASVHFDAQDVDVNGKTYSIALRFRRYYKDYEIKLLKFTHEKYAGSDTDKTFSSRIRLADARHNERRDILISMNEPLRYDGDTFYQSGFDDETSPQFGGVRKTILQIVRNPGASLPYISCSLVALGMLVHFGIQLVKFLRRRLA